MHGTRAIKKIKSPEKKEKPSNTAPKATALAAAAPKATASKPSKPSKPLNIPHSDVSPELKRLVVTELIKSGKARIIRGKKKDILKK